jgi:cyclohexyl-isocyanide hydratase
MPHVRGSLPRDAVRELDLASLAAHSDAVGGTRIALVAFAGMTLLDLVGPLDALSRIASMGFDPTTTCEVVAMTRLAGEGASQGAVWSAFGAELRAERYRPELASFDVVVVPGGPGTRALEADAEALAWLGAFPANRLVASVCTGSLLLGAVGRLRGRRATTHASMLAELPRFGAVVARERVVDEGQLVTSGGVTAGLDLGLHLVARLAGDEARAAISAQMELPVGR